MQVDNLRTQLIGFEKDEDLGSLLAKFGMFQDYKATLPEHLLAILKQQHPETVIESIELLGVPKCELGGMQQQSSSLITVQTMNVPLELRLTLRIGAGRYVLDVRLDIKGAGLDSTPTVKSDMFVKAQSRAT